MLFLKLPHILLNGGNNLYHSNLFQLIKYDPLPIFRYEVNITPKPSNRPQLYQILGKTAKKIMKEEHKVVVSHEGKIESLSEQITLLNDHHIEINDELKFSVNLTFKENVEISISNFQEYKLLVNRLIDIALTYFSNTFYKFHPDAPYVIRDEPYFDQELIKTTGIMDSKKYYRTLYEFDGKPFVLIDRETELQSNKNLLIEIKSLQQKFESITSSKIDFNDPPPEFVNYVNSLIRGKAARVLQYPGPSIRRIKEITWEYRAKDIIPGTEKPIITYFKEHYGIINLDPNQPLILYEVENTHKKQYHVPQLLSLGHNFHDLALRIPTWQRTQVWGSIQPDCKNQLHKTYEIFSEIDRVLRNNVPKIYPGLIEISKMPMDVSDKISTPNKITLQFFDGKQMEVNPPYDIEFYKKYSKKKIKFYDEVPSLTGFVHTTVMNDKIQNFLVNLEKEFELRTNNSLKLILGEIDFEKKNFLDHDFVLTIMNEQDKFSDTIYKKCKKIIQNENSIMHQHITERSANDDSVMQIIMELVLKLGKNPWTLSGDNQIKRIVGIHTYSNPSKDEDLIFVNILDGNGNLIEQYDPIDKTAFDQMENNLIKQNLGRTLYLFSHDKYDLGSLFNQKISLENKIDPYTIVQLVDKNHVRIFETWKPKPMKRFGKSANDGQNKSPIESQEKAPQGIALKSSDAVFYLLTGRTIELSSLKRGCPTPLQINILNLNDTNWKAAEVVDYILKLCMMSRTSGHMTRMPAPIYYLHSYGNYYNNFGAPRDDKFKRTLFHI